MSLGQQERRLLDLERKALQLPQELLAAERRVAALEQGLAKLWSFGGTAECEVTITGHAKNLFSVGIPDMTVEVWRPDNTGDQVGSTVLTNASGDYTINASIELGTSGDTARIYFSKSRYNSLDFDFASITPGSIPLSCGSNPVNDVQLFAASGYEASRVCVDPLSDNLTIIDSVHGTIALAWSAFFNFWIGHKTVAGTLYDWIFDAVAIGTEPNIVKVRNNGTLAAMAHSTASSVGCNPLSYSGSGPGIAPLYVPGTISWTVTDP